MSIVSYNGITLPYAETTSFIQKIVRDESGTDRMYNHYDISITAIINSDYLILLAPTIPGNVNPEPTNPADIMLIVQRTLLQDRKRLSFTFNGRELIPQAQIGNRGTVDAKNGPQPQDCKFIQLCNTTFLMSFHIVANYWLGTAISGVDWGANVPGDNVLNNRWSESVDIDANQFTIRTREGTFIIRSDNTAGFIADQVRTQMAVVSLPKKFMRESSHYTVSPDGLSIKYKIIDKEVYKMPPYPAFKASGKYTDSTTLQGSQRFGEVIIKLEGDNITGQNILAELALRLACTKLKMAGASLQRGTRGQGFGQLFYAILVIDLFNNIVECKVRVRMLPNSPTTPAGTPSQRGRVAGTWGLDWRGMTDTPYPTQDGAITPPLYRDRGTAGLLLQAATYYDPSVVGHALANSQIDGPISQHIEAGDSKVQMNKGKMIGTVGQTGE